MTGATITNLIIGVAVLAWVVSRPLTTRRPRENYRLAVILAVIGVVQFAAFLKGHPDHDGAIAAAVAGSLVIAAVFIMLNRAARLEAAGQRPLSEASS